VPGRRSASGGAGASGRSSSLRAGSRAADGVRRAGRVSRHSRSRLPRPRRSARPPSRRARRRRRRSTPEERRCKRPAPAPPPRRARARPRPRGRAGRPARPRCRVRGVTVAWVVGWIKQKASSTARTPRMETRATRPRRYHWPRCPLVAHGAFHGTDQPQITVMTITLDHRTASGLAHSMLCTLFIVLIVFIVYPAREHKFSVSSRTSCQPSACTLFFCVTGKGTQVLCRMALMCIRQGNASSLAHTLSCISRHQHHSSA
jgi:hypothetical protein